MNFIGACVFWVPLPWRAKAWIAARVGKECKHGWLVGDHTLIINPDR